MRKLFIDDRNTKVLIAELALISNKQQFVIGNDERDLILRTSGNIKVQVGNKFYNLPFSKDESGDTIINTTDNFKPIILNNTLELEKLTYPGDGSLIFTKTEGNFYISVKGKYILINKVDKDKKIYLAFDEEQVLTGSEKSQVLFNAGYILDKFEDVKNLTASSVYPKQIIFALEEGKHYQLINSKFPSDTDSWKELYLSLDGGGTVNGTLIINAITGNGLQIFADYLSNFLPENETNYKGFYLGDDYAKGLGIWKNDEEIFISNQSKLNGKINFITNNEDGSQNKPLTIHKGNVGINGWDSGYTFNVVGNSNFTDIVELSRGTRSPDFAQGPEGVGFDLTVDGHNKWTLEVDKLIVREKSEEVDLEIAKDKYESKAINGSIILNGILDITEIEQIETIGVYVSKLAVGKNSGSEEFPLKNRGTKVMAKYTPISEIAVGNITKSYSVLNLAYGIGDLTDAGAPVSYSTTDSNGSTIAGTHQWNNTTQTYEEVANGPLVLMDTINVYAIKSIDNSLAVGDLFYYKEWNANKTFKKVIAAEIKLITSDSIIIYVYGSHELKVTDKIIKVGNLANGNIALIQLNGFDTTAPYIEVNSDIVSLNNFAKNIYYENLPVVEDEEESSSATSTLQSLFDQKKIRVKQGYLSNLEDEDLNLELDNTEVGIYSDNAYIKGNFVSIRHIMGEELWFIDDVLWIKDLEIIKARIIKGSHGLNGGGEILYDADVDIQHDEKIWVDKEDLTGANIITNIILDDYGHPIDWETRELTIDDIPELTDTLSDKEDKINKQNSLDVDGTGTKYPTVDIINEKIEELVTAIDNADKHFEYNQNVPSDIWYITHPLNKKPAISIVDSAGTIVNGEIKLMTNDYVVVAFSAPFSGTAILN